MRGTVFLISAALICQELMCQEMTAQEQPGIMSFQPAQSLAVGRGPDGRGVILALPRMEAGKPFSATANTRTSQTLADGTHVSQTTTMVEYRDAEGRVRTEASQPGSSVSIMIRDPVAGVRYVLDAVARTATKSTIAAWAVGPVGGGGRSGAGPRNAEQRQEILDKLLDLATAMKSAQASMDPAAVLRARQQARDLEADLKVRREARNDPNVKEEDLGTAIVNGVSARGTRITTAIPAGAIGNDREFHSVEEKWFSPDLDLMVKSVSTDPRFGTTTYELTNISRQAPDAELFRVPAGYGVVSR